MCDNYSGITSGTALPSTALPTNTTYKVKEYIPEYKCPDCPINKINLEENICKQCVRYKNAEDKLKAFEGFEGMEWANVRYPCYPTTCPGVPPGTINEWFKLT